jgi:hypothetical protein
MWRRESPEAARLDIKARYGAGAFAPDGKTLLTCNSVGIVRHWELTEVD